MLAYHHIGRFHGDRSFGPWFYRIVTNASRQRMRSRRRLRESPLRGHNAASAEEKPTGLNRFHRQSAIVDPAALAEQNEERAVLLAALDALTRKQREVVVLRFYLGYSDQECAAILGCRPGAARARLHAGLQTLRRHLRNQVPWFLSESRAVASERPFPAEVLPYGAE